MRGSIRKHGAGWEYTVALEPDPLTHNRKRKSKGGFKTKKECEKAMNILISQIENGEYFEIKEISIAEFLKKWLDAVKNKVGTTTYVSYEDIVNRILIKSFGGTKINKLNPLQIQDFINEQTTKGLSGATVKKYYDILNIALNQAIAWRIIQYNPCKVVEHPKASKAKMAVLSVDQVTILLNYTKESEFNIMYLPLLLAITTGMRRGEILGLTWKNIDLETGIITVENNLTRLVTGKIILTTPKTDRSMRNISMLPSTIAILNQYKDEMEKSKIELGDAYNKEDYVCCWHDGSPLKPDYLTHTLSKLLVKCNLPHLRFHDLRHTHATLMLTNNINTKVVSERLGHSDITTTLDVYSHIIPGMQKEAARILDETLFKNPQ